MNTYFVTRYELDDNLALDMNSFNILFRERLNKDTKHTNNNDSTDSSIGSIGNVLIVNPALDLIGGVLHINNIRYKFSRGETYLAYIPIGIDYNFLSIERGGLHIISSVVKCNNLPKNVLIDVLSFSVMINPFTRIVESTGRRLPTDSELALMLEMEPEDNYEKVKRDILLGAITVDKIEDTNKLFVSHYKIYESLLALLENFDDNNDVCDFGTGDGSRLVDKKKRVCSKKNTEWTTAGITKNFNELLKSRLGTDIEVVLKEDEILKYEVGSHFEKHTDRIRDPNMIGTLLLVLPSNDLDGGILNVDGFNIEHNPGEHHLVYLPIGLPHSVSRIKQGTRYVFKACVYAVNLPSNVVLQILNKYISINPFTRIVLETGNRLPTDDELSKLSSRRFENYNTLIRAISVDYKSEVLYD